jgi:predicted ATPase/class 3 adenylate cyclase
MFTDIEGSTRLARLLGDSYGTVLNAHRSVVRAALRDYGGAELFTEGDSFFVAFSDAAAAVAASVTAQRNLAAHPWPGPDVALRVRMGLHTGWATPVADEYASAEVHRAARVAAAAHGGQILCSQMTALAAATSSPDLSCQPAQGPQAFGAPAELCSPFEINPGELNPYSDPGGVVPSTPGTAGWTRSGRPVPPPAPPREHPQPSRDTNPQPSRDTNTTSRFAGLLSTPRVPLARRDVERVLAGVDLLDLGPHRLRGFDDADRLFQLVGAGLERDFPRVRTPGAPGHNLPAALTSFVGRQAEIAELTGLVGRHRLVTVTGAGGAGKTRIALAAAGELLVAYPDGVWLIDAATGGSDLMATLAAALGLRTEPGRPLVDTVVEHCAGRRMLIVLDTCEAAPVAGFVRRLLSACPEVAVLATGRELVGVHGEVVWRVPPLAPDEAFALLSERAAAARGGRAVGAAEAADLTRVILRLDGLPLAVELAAARLQLLSPAQLAGRLDDLLTVLDGLPATHDPMVTTPAPSSPPGMAVGGGSVGHDAAVAGRVPGAAPKGAREPVEGDDVTGRQESLTRSLDWSYQRLGRSAAALLRRLSVFAGAVELSAVEWFGADALGALSELAAKSMVEVEPGPSYRMSAAVRAYAGRRLAGTGEEPAARDRHVAWALHLLDSASLDADGQPRTVAPVVLAPHVGEWTAAVRWAATGGSVRAGLRLAGALAPWWREQSGTRSGRDLLYRLYGRLAGAGVPPAELASAYLVHAGLSDDRTERDRFLDRAELMARRADDPTLLVRALAGRRITLVEQRSFADAEQLCRRVVARAEQTGVAGAALPSVLALAELLWRRDELDEAAELLGAARQLEAGRPQDRGRRTVDWLLGMVALRRGDLVAAHDHLVVALRSRLRHGFRGAAADAVAALAVRCAVGGDPGSAAVLFGGVESAQGERRSGVFGPFWSAQQAAVRATLGDKTFDTAYVDGAEAGFDAVVARALAVEHPDLAHGSARFAPTLR